MQQMPGRNAYLDGLLGATDPASRPKGSIYGQGAVWQTLWGLPGGRTLGRKSAEGRQRTADPRGCLDHIKGQFFRVVHADGIIGGSTPQGQLHIAFYSERPPIPKRTVHQVSAGGALGSPIPEKTVVRDCTAIRELDLSRSWNNSTYGSDNGWTK